MSWKKVGSGATPGAQMSWRKEALERRLEVKCHGNNKRWIEILELKCHGQKPALERLLEVKRHGNSKRWKAFRSSNVMVKTCCGGTPLDVKCHAKKYYPGPTPGDQMSWK